MNYLKMIVVSGLCVSTAMFAQSIKDGKKDKDIVVADKKIMAAVKPSVVQVEYFLKFDKGQEPSIIGYKCGNCNLFHNTNAAKYVKDDRPVQVPGYLTASDKVLTADILAHPRFVKSIKVKYGQTFQTATICSYFTKQNGIELKLDNPLEGTTPFVFDSTAKAPFFNVSYSNDKGFWLLSVSPFSRNKLIYLYENNMTYCLASANSAIVSKEGKAVAFSTMSRMPIDDSWKKAPAQWQQYSAVEMKNLLKMIEAKVNQGIFRVRLSFRSPKADKALSYAYREGEKVETEINTVGLLLDNQRLMILADLESRTTARLESIVAFPPGTKPLIADFDCTLKDYGLLLAKFKKTVPYSGVKLSGKLLLDKLGDLLPAAEIRVTGEEFNAYYSHSRIAEFDTGWKGMKFPVLPENSLTTFLFNSQGELTAFPVRRREPADMQGQYGGGNPMLTQCAYLVPILVDIKNNIDPSNIPLSEEEENRIAWLGIESQPLNPELAKAHNISEQTKDGKNGILITYVYAGSPAAKAGLKAGDIILRLYIQGDPSPIDIRTREQRTGQFPWSRLESLPEMYYDRIPAPWQSVENSVNRLLTNLGFGKKFTLVCYIDNKMVSKHFTVEQAPEHYENASKGYSKYLGLTVRNMTFELRRYFQMKKDTPGIIISKIKPGSRASVSGLKPYEIITHINDQPVSDVSEFKKLINGHKDLRLSVKRMFESRLVKINMDQDQVKKDKKEIPIKK